MRQLLSLGMARLVDCPTASAIAIAVLGVFSGCVAYLTNALLMRLGTSGNAYAVVDAAVIGAVAATIGALVIVGFRERRKRDIARLHVVAELNHNVRNALQVIVDDYYLSRDKHTEAVLESVERIDNTLRSLFPAEPAVMVMPTRAPQKIRADARAA